MRCIETVYGGVVCAGLHPINRNMRCIETAVANGCRSCEAPINRNMRCIETSPSGGWNVSVCRLIET